MEQRIQKTLMGTTRSGEEVWSFRIPNNTHDCLEVSTYGCSIRSLSVHDGRGEFNDLVRGMGSLEEYEASGQTGAALLDGPEALAASLARKAWEVADQGENYVLLSCGCPAGESGVGCDVKVGARIMWVNLNRLVLDFFLTPKESAALSLGGKLPVRGAGEAYQVRSFCPRAALPGHPAGDVEQTPYGQQQFRPVEGAVFLSGAEDIKPMAELWAPGSGMTISVYSTLTAVQAAEASGGVVLRQWMDRPVDLKAGETLAGRVIYGVDYPRPQTEPGPFGLFGI